MSGSETPEVLDFTPDDLKDLPNTISIIGQVACGPSGTGKDGHRQLGIHVAHKAAINAADEACMAIGIMGVGKTKSMEAQQYLGYKPKWYDQDYATLASISPEDQRYLSGSSVLWVTMEASTASEMAFENTLKAICTILTDNNHSIHVKTSGYEVNIENCRLSWLGGVAYDLYNIIWLSPHFKGNFRDRIHKYHQFRFKARDVNDAIPKPYVPLPKVDPLAVKVEENDGFGEVREMLHRQFTDERSYLWARKLGQGNAALNGRDHTTSADWKFLKLFRFNYEVERSVGSRTTFTGSLQMDIDALDIFARICKAGECSLDYLMDEAQMYDLDYAENVIHKYDGKLWETVGGIHYHNIEDGRRLLRKEIREFDGHVWQRRGNRLEVEEGFLQDFIKPQLEFEDHCMLHWRRYVDYDPAQLAQQWRPPERPNRSGLSVMVPGKKP